MDKKLICKLCRRPCDKFAKSHIIPRGFFKKSLIPCEVNQSAWDMVSFCATGEGRKLRNVLYDPNILCPACEHHILAPLDDYAVQVYRDFKDATFLDISDMSSDFKAAAREQGMDEVKFVFLKDVDRCRLRAFFASLLWRCHVSNLVELETIDIGQTYEKRIRNDLLIDGTFEYVDAIAFSLTDLAHECLIMPCRKRFNVDGLQANGYTLQLPHLEFRVSLDQRRNPYDRGRVDFGEYEGSKWKGTMSLRKEYNMENLLIFQTRRALHQWSFIRNEFHKYSINRQKRQKVAEKRYAR